MAIVRHAHHQQEVEAVAVGAVGGVHAEDFAVAMEVVRHWWRHEEQTAALTRGSVHVYRHQRGLAQSAAPLDGVSPILLVGLVGDMADEGAEEVAEDVVVEADVEAAGEVFLRPCPSRLTVRDKLPHHVNHLLRHVLLCPDMTGLSRHRRCRRLHRQEVARVLVTHLLDGQQDVAARLAVGHLPLTPAVDLALVCVVDLRITAIRLGAWLLIAPALKGALHQSQLSVVVWVMSDAETERLHILVKVAVQLICAAELHARTWRSYSCRCARSRSRSNRGGRHAGGRHGCHHDQKV